MPAGQIPPLHSSLSMPSLLPYDDELTADSVPAANAFSCAFATRWIPRSDVIQKPSRVVLENLEHAVVVEAVLDGHRSEPAILEAGPGRHRKCQSTGRPFSRDTAPGRCCWEDRRVRSNSRSRSCSKQRQPSVGADPQSVGAAVDDDADVVAGESIGCRVGAQGSRSRSARGHGSVPNQIALAWSSWIAATHRPIRNDGFVPTRLSRPCSKTLRPPLRESRLATHNRPERSWATPWSSCSPGHRSW